jgi:hypothetical protein
MRKDSLCAETESLKTKIRSTSNPETFLRFLRKDSAPRGFQSRRCSLRCRAKGLATRRNSEGLVSTLTSNDQLPVGFVMNPAHITSPARFGRRAAASFAANGVEKDSAMRRNRLLLGTTSFAQGTSSEYERNRCVGYRAMLTLNVGGSAERKSAKSVPVPSRPGRSTSVSTVKSSPPIAFYPNEE